MAALALAFAGGAAALVLPGSSPVARTAATLLPLLPIAAWRGPGRGSLLVAAAAGLLAGRAAAGAAHRCAPALEGAALVRGFLAAPAAADGRGTLMRSDGAGCPPVRVAGVEGLTAGEGVRVAGRWRQGRYGAWLQVERTEPEAGAGSPAAAWRGRLLERLQVLYPRRWGVVAALTLARREGLSSGVREAFARAGTAHLLAISGFHVGLLGAMVLTLLRAAGLGRGAAGAGAAALVWAYVLFLGAPPAAARAALMITAAAAARLSGRPPARWSAPAFALLVLALLRPADLAAAGFQLSFAGVAGLVAWAPPLARRLDAAAAGRVPQGLVRAVAAGVAATLATAPVVAWHFGRISLVGVPATLLSSPLVALALPGAAASLLLDPVWPPGAGFLAGGVTLLLDLLTALTQVAARPDWASLAVSRSTVLTVTAALALAWRPWRGGGRRVSAAARTLVRLATAAGVVSLWSAGAAAARRGTMDLYVLDVGQGDAVAVRTPGGHWLLVDAGPPGRPPRAPPVLSRLRELGVRRIDWLAFTHPDLDHVGGGVAVLEGLRVDGVLDPGMPAGREAYVRILRAAGRHGVPWRRVRAPFRWSADGVEFEVLHPQADARGGGGVSGDPSNATSLVMLVRYGTFEALLTGDAPAEVEAAVAARVDARPLEVLKVAHHGSMTSTDSTMLRRLRPELALVSAGRGNRFGHPRPEVLRRLAAAGARVARTDLQGTLRVRVHRDGRYRLRAQRLP